MLLLLFLNELAFDQNLDLITGHPAAIEHHIKRQAIVPPVNLAFGTITDAVAHQLMLEIDWPLPLCELSTYQYLPVKFVQNGSYHPHDRSYSDHNQDR